MKYPNRDEIILSVVEEQPDITPARLVSAIRKKHKKMNLGTDKAIKERFRDLRKYHGDLFLHCGDAITLVQGKTVLGRIRDFLHIQF